MKSTMLSINNFSNEIGNRADSDLMELTTMGAIQLRAKLHSHRALPGHLYDPTKA